MAPSNTPRLDKKRKARLAKQKKQAEREAREEDRRLRGLTFEQLSKLDAANSIVNIVDACLPAFRTFDRNGLHLSIQCSPPEYLRAETQLWALNLLERNMKDLYASSSWGWSREEKADELDSKMSRIIVATDARTGDPVAFASFRFDMDDGEVVLYLYEIQLEDKVRRHGLGKFLLQILQLLAFKTGMVKVMATVFKSNQTSLQFFGAQDYAVDRTNNMEPACDYLILSKYVAKGLNRIKTMTFPVSAAQTAPPDEEGKTEPPADVKLKVD